MLAFPREQETLVTHAKYFYLPHTSDASRSSRARTGAQHWFNG
jgi:hypothetical protein